MTTLLTLCWEFFKTGLFAVGGGLATLPFLTQMQQRFGWFTAEALGNMIAISESTPGPIGVNMATYVGYTTGGILSGVLATLCLVLPSLIVILVIAKALDKYKNSAIIQNMFAFMRPAVTGLIAAAGFAVLKIALFRDSVFSFGSIHWAAVAFFAVMVFFTQWKKTRKLHPIAFIALGAAVGIIFGM